MAYRTSRGSSSRKGHLEYGTLLRGRSIGLWREVEAELSSTALEPFEARDILESPCVNGVSISAYPLLEVGCDMICLIPSLKVSTSTYCSALGMLIC